VIFLLFYAATHTYSEFSLKYTGDLDHDNLRTKLN